MCGITGYWSLRQHDETLWRELPAAVASLHRRGPDDLGLWRNNQGVGLGHARLAIIDLSAAGHQPMLTEDGRLAVVFNGEIYNHREIRHALLEQGYQFHSDSDTEVALAAFHCWGMKALDKFIGMFAIALWDAASRRLFLVRDRIGVKPLYYGWNGDTIWFGSELKALRAFGHWPPEIDRQALGEMLQYGYIGAPRSIYRDIKKVPAGHWLEISEAHPPRLHQYWSAITQYSSPLQQGADAIEEELEALLINAFRYRMVADVPVGVFLSGGIDSSLVAALLQRHSGQQIHTFTIGFTESTHDESIWARRVAEHLGTAHTEMILTATDAREVLPQWGELFDEPFGDSSGIPTYLVARLARQHVKVALSADGGDELFGGYPYYNEIAARRAGLNRIPLAVRIALGAAITRLPLVQALSHLPGPAHARHAVRRKIAERLYKLGYMLPQLQPGMVFDAAISFWMPHEICRLMGGYTNPRQQLDRHPGNFREQMAYADFLDYLPDDIMAKVDRTSMSVGLEAREPLLDHRIAEFAFALPSNLRWGALGAKHILRKILYRHVPQALIDRPKQGFSIPLSRWLRGDLSYLVRDYLDVERIRSAGLFDPNVVGQVVNNFLSGGVRGDRVDVEKLWLLLAFEMWREKWA